MDVSACQHPAQQLSHLLSSDEVAALLAATDYADAYPHPCPHPPVGQMGPHALAPGILPSHVPALAHPSLSAVAPPPPELAPTHPTLIHASTHPAPLVTPSYAGHAPASAPPPPACAHQPASPLLVQPSPDRSILGYHACVFAHHVSHLNAYDDTSTGAGPSNASRVLDASAAATTAYVPLGLARPAPLPPQPAPPVPTGPALGTSNTLGWSAPPAAAAAAAAAHVPRAALAAPPVQHGCGHRQGHSHGHGHGDGHGDACCPPNMAPSPAPAAQPSVAPRLTLQERRKLARLREARSNLWQSLQTRSAHQPPHTAGSTRAPAPAPAHSPGSFSGSSWAHASSPSSGVPGDQPACMPPLAPPDSSLLASSASRPSISTHTSFTNELPSLTGGSVASSADTQLAATPQAPSLDSAGLSPLGDKSYSALAAAAHGPHGHRIADVPRPIRGTASAAAVSSMGFDMLQALLRVASRPDPVIQLGPVSLSAAFAVADVRQTDMPLVYCSDSFLRLVGYDRRDVLGRNCRFLQAPPPSPVGAQGEGSAPAPAPPPVSLRHGDIRTTTDPAAVAHLARHLSAMHECQASLVNYRRNGQPFLNLVSLVPIGWGDDPAIRYVVGFQVDLAARSVPGLESARPPPAPKSLPVAPQPESNTMPAPSQQLSAPLPPLTPLAGVQVPAQAPFSQRAEAEAGRAQPHDLTGSGSGFEPAPPCTPGVWMADRPGADPRKMANARAVMRLLYPSSGESSSSDAAADESDVDAATSSVARRCNWSGIVLENSPDAIFVMSLKGILLYVSPSMERMTGWNPLQLSGKSLGNFIHPADVVPVFRQLKDSTSTPVLRDVAHRNRRKKPTAASVPVTPSGSSDVDAGFTAAGSVANASGTVTGTGATSGTDAEAGAGRAAESSTSSPSPSARPEVHLLFRMQLSATPERYRWIESVGRLHVENGKGRKVVVCSARPRDIQHAAPAAVQPSAALAHPGFWARISFRTGILIAVTMPVMHYLDRTPHDLVGRSVKELVAPASSADALISALESHHTTCVRHTLLNAAGTPVSVVSTVQRSGARSRVGSGSGTAGNSTTGTRCPPPHLDRSAWVHICPDGADGMCGPDTQAAATTSPARDARRSAGAMAVQDMPPRLELNADADGEVDVDAHKQHEYNSPNPVFPEFDTRCSSSWPYELQQLRLLNKRLRQDVRAAYSLAQQRRQQQRQQQQQQQVHDSAVSDEPMSTAADELVNEPAIEATPTLAPKSSTELTERQFQTLLMTHPVASPAAPHAPELNGKRAREHEREHDADRGRGRDRVTSPGALTVTDTEPGSWGRLSLGEAGASGHSHMSARTEGDSRRSVSLLSTTRTSRSSSVAFAMPRTGTGTGTSMVTTAEPSGSGCASNKPSAGSTSADDKAGAFDDSTASSTSTTPLFMDIMPFPLPVDASLPDTGLFAPLLQSDALPDAH